MPQWLAAALALATLVAVIWLAGSQHDRAVRRVIGTAPADVRRAALRAAGFQAGWLAVLLLGYLLGIVAAELTGHTWTSMVFVLPVTLWWGSRAIVLAPAEHGPSAPEIVQASGATRGVARAVLAVSFPFVLVGASAATAGVAASTGLLQ